MMFEALQGRVISTASLDSLKFGGNGENPYEWLSQIDRFFTLRNLPDEQRLSFVFYHLEGEALAWFQWLEMNCLLTSWSGFLQLFKSRFGSKFDDPLTRLLNLSQMRSVRDYQTEFEDKATHVTKVPEAILDSELLSRKGLQPTTLTEAFDVVYSALERNYQENKTTKVQEDSDEVEFDVYGDLISRNSPKLPAMDEISAYLLPSFSTWDKRLRCQEDAAVAHDCKEDMLSHWWEDVLHGFSRRGVIFSLYALEEVYKDILESPP